MLRVESVMGMPIRIDVRDPEVGPEAVQAAFDWLAEVDVRFSTWKPHSEISRINRGELALGDAHPDVTDVLARCLDLGELTGGYFDAWAVAHGVEGDGRDPSVFLPGAVEPSGLVKGWSVERAGKLLDEMVPSINKTSDLVQEITAASEEQTSGVGQINTAMSQMNQITQQNASASEELAATAEEMSGQAEQLQQTMSFFKLESGGGMSGVKKSSTKKLTQVARPNPAKGKTAPSATAGASDELEFVRF